MIASADMFHASTITGLPAPRSEHRAFESELALERRVVTPLELIESVNRELALRSDCQGLEIQAGPLRAGLPDAYGCNWNVGALRVRVAHGASTRALAGVRQVVDWARHHFELAEPDAA